MKEKGRMEVRAGIKVKLYERCTEIFINSNIGERRAFVGGRSLAVYFSAPLEGKIEFWSSSKFIQSLMGVYSRYSRLMLLVPQ